MSERRENDELAAVEETFRSLTPAGSRIARDRLMFLAGQASTDKTWRRRRRLLSSWVVVDQAVAQDAKAKQSAARVVSLIVHPAVPPTPVLKYHLLPTFLQQTPGNAIPFYAKAFIFEQQSIAGTPDRDFFSMLTWLETPLEKFPREKVRAMLDRFHGAMHQVELASRCERCDWDLPLRQGRVFEIPLPDVQEFRFLARLFALRARLQIADKQYAAALDSLQVGYSMARQVAEQPFLVSGFLGMVIVGMMDRQLLELCQQPDAPNFYWSLAELPNPIIDPRNAIKAEYDGLYLQLPKLQALRRARLAPEQWDLELRDTVAKLVVLPTVVGDAPDSRNRKVASVVSQMLAAAPAAKADLAAAGYSPKELDAMPPSQVVLLHILSRYETLRDDLFKWTGVPYWQAREGFEAFEHDIKTTKGRELFPVASVILPQVGQFAFSAARIERELAAMQCIEALRFYAATHESKLPTTLDAIKAVPIPLNPVTGKPFKYRLEGETAIFDTDGGRAGSEETQYRVRIAKTVASKQKDTP